MTSLIPLHQEVCLFIQEVPFRRMATIELEKLWQYPIFWIGQKEGSCGPSLDSLKSFSRIEALHPVWGTRFLVPLSRAARCSGAQSIEYLNPQSLTVLRPLMRLTFLPGFWPIHH